MALKDLARALAVKGVRTGLTGLPPLPPLPSTKVHPLSGPDQPPRAAPSACPLPCTAPLEADGVAKPSVPIADDRNVDNGADIAAGLQRRRTKD